VYKDQDGVGIRTAGIVLMGQVDAKQRIFAIGCFHLRKEGSPVLSIPGRFLGDIG
jgi:hypothetical protein